MTSPDTPTVFIIDDDARMRAATQRLLRTVGLRSESFATPEVFSTAQASRWSQLPPAGCATPWNEWLDVQHKLIAGSGPSMRARISESCARAHRPHYALSINTARVALR
jgi:hypothetical protein